MFVIYDDIRLDASHTSVTANEAEWAINPKNWIMQHGPTGMVFEISMDREKIDTGSVTILDFSSTLRAISDGEVLPPPERIEELGRTAIVLFLTVTGHVRPIAVDADISEETFRNAQAC
jgi:hypothetical protein